MESSPRSKHTSDQASPYLWFDPSPFSDHGREDEVPECANLSVHGGTADVCGGDGILVGVVRPLCDGTHGLT